MNHHYTLIAYRPDHTWSCARGCCYESSSSEHRIAYFPVDQQDRLIGSICEYERKNEAKVETEANFKLTVLLDGIKIDDKTIEDNPERREMIASYEGALSAARTSKRS